MLFIWRSLFALGVWSSLQVGPASAQQPLTAFHSARSEEVALQQPNPNAVRYIEQIMAKIGLPMRFEVYAGDVSNAQAQVRNGKRQIIYNPHWMLELVTSAQTNWAMVQTLAHEVGHHLSFHEGYTGDAKQNQAQELEADYFSGYILARLGASVDHATVADRVLVAADSATHPGSDRRIQEITRGWRDANGQVATTAAARPTQPAQDAKRDTTMGASAAGHGRRTVWDHNGSEMYLVGEGSTRRFLYAKPRGALLEAGARPGTLLFAGDRVGSTYRGISHVFSSRCGKFFYEVTGTVEPGDLRIILKGKAPAGIDATCNVTSRRDDTLIFQYLRTE